MTSNEKNSSESSGAPTPEVHWREKAELYELGLLSHVEREELENELRKGSPDVKEAIARARALTGALGLTASTSEKETEKHVGGKLPAGMPAGMRERLLAKAREVKTQVWKSWTASGGRPGDLTLVGKGDGAWESLNVPGILVRKLNVNSEQDRVTMLVKMEPGSSYPRHRHGGHEECYVLDGDLQVGDKFMSAGDYQFAGAGSPHAVQSTRGGCLLFISSSMSDELLQ